MMINDGSQYFPAPTGSGAPVGTPVGQLVIGGNPYPWQLTVISQFANSPRIIGLIASFAAAASQQTDIDKFYDDFWNIQTAYGYGLDVWGRIVVVKRTLQVSSRFFGFDEGNGNGDYDPFNQSPFYAGGSTTSAYNLTDDAYRLLILAKTLANISYGSITGINAILQLLFANRGACYVRDNNDMTMTYVFGFTPTPVELAIILTSNVLPRPTGIAVNYEVP
jgi:hypothetical protein